MRRTQTWFEWQDQENLFPLSNEDPKKQEELLEEIKQIVAGTHYSVLTQDPKVKRKTKKKTRIEKGST